MTWYLKYKTSQFVNYQSLVNAIYQRLVQAGQGGVVAENAFDDIQSQGYDQVTIENAIQQAVIKLFGSAGGFMQLNDSQRHLLQTLRNVQPIPIENLSPNAESVPMSQDAGEGVMLN